MNQTEVRELPPEAFSRGVKKLKKPPVCENVLILGFDCEYTSDHHQQILCYQLSDGTNSALIEADEDWTWDVLEANIRRLLKEWGYSIRNYRTIALISHFSTAELSHIKDFWRDAKVRRVSPQQVFNADKRLTSSLMLSIVDQYHFFQKPLVKVAPVWGEEKMEYDTTNVTAETLKDPVFREYAVWDAVVCARIFTKFRNRLIEEYGIDPIRYPTPASVAMAVYRKHYQLMDYEKPERAVREQAWLSLWGGRAEAYFHGDLIGGYTLRDVKSLYPTSAINLRELPTPNDWIERLRPVTWKGLCRVEFKFPEHVRYPCLPVQYESESGHPKLIFPLAGVADCTLEEAYVALKLGADLTFLKVFEYETGTPDLRLYMESFMDKKDAAEDAGDDAGRELAKLMMNALIGKFSQHRGDVDLEEVKEFAQTLGMPPEVVMSECYADPEYPRPKARIGGNIMPEWSALILGKARAIMAELLNAVDSYICSTDSLLVPDDQNHIVDRVMEDLNVLLTNKNEPCPQCPDGLTKTAWVRVVRNRAYAAMCNHGSVAFGANHAVHLPKRGDVALKFILSNQTQYRKRKHLGLLQAVKTGNRFFAMPLHKDGNPGQPMVFSRKWDYKRYLNEDGSSRPWLSLREARTVEARGISTPTAWVESEEVREQVRQSLHPSRKRKRE